MNVLDSVLDSKHKEIDYKKELQRLIEEHINFIHLEEPSNKLKQYYEEYCDKLEDKYTNIFDICKLLKENENKGIKKGKLAKAINKVEYLKYHIEDLEDAHLRFFCELAEHSFKFGLVEGFQLALIYQKNEDSKELTYELVVKLFEEIVKDKLLV